MHAQEQICRTLLENFPNGIVCVFDHDLRYTALDGMVLASRGRSSEEFVGKTIWEALPPETCRQIEPLYRAALAGEKSFAEVPFAGRIYAAHIVPVPDETGRIVAGLVMAVDITEHKLTEERMRQQFERQMALRSIDSAIISSFDVRRTLGFVLDQILAVLGVSAANILVLTSEGLIECVADRGFRGGPATSCIQYGEGTLGCAVRDGRSVYLMDLFEETADFERAAFLQTEGFQDYCALPLMTTDRINGLLEIYDYASLDHDPDWWEFLETLAGQAAIAIDNASLVQGLQRSNQELAEAYDTTIEGWSRALDLRDRETEGHCQRVTTMTLRLAEQMGISEAELVHIRRGALLHDIGKMGVPDSILLKPGPLTEEEWAIMRKHPEYAYDMLYSIAFLRPALDIPCHHHEKWDGTGYPFGLKGDEIPLAARIFSVVDVWDALRSDRPYRSACPEEKVREHIRSLAGTHFDPAVVEAFLRLDI